MFDVGNKAFWGGVLATLAVTYAVHHFVHPMPGGKQG